MITIIINHKTLLSFKMQPIVVLWSVFLVTVSCSPFSSEWLQFKDFVEEYGKPYKNDSTTIMKRFEAFKVFF